MLKHTSITLCNLTIVDPYICPFTVYILDEDTSSLCMRRIGMDIGVTFLSGQCDVGVSSVAFQDTSIVQ